ncbi:MAG: hypothetical protein ACRC7S_14675 [Cetobacterium sp.]
MKSWEEKSWEEMSSKERAEQTIRDIKRRQELREKGKKEADNFIFEQCFKAKRNRDKIRSKIYRGEIIWKPNMK